MRTLLLLALGLSLTLNASAQVFDPDPSEPNAQQDAEFRFLAARIDLTPPPVGWLCYPVLAGDPDGLFFFGAHCEPDPVLIDEQRRELEAWKRRMMDRARRPRQR